MFADCYTGSEPDGFPVATYHVPDGVDLQKLRKKIEQYFSHVKFVEQSNGCAVQMLPEGWVSQK